MPLLRTHWKQTERTASKYMKLAREEERLIISNRNHASDLEPHSPPLNVEAFGRFRKRPCAWPDAMRGPREMSLDVELRSSQGCARSLRNRTLPRRASITASSATIALRNDCVTSPHDIVHHDRVRPCYDDCSSDVAEGLTMEANAGAIDYGALASALGGVLMIVIMIWMAIALR